MIKKFIANTAAKLGVKLSNITLVNGEHVGCIDASLLHVSDGRHHIYTLIYHSELDDLNNGKCCTNLSLKIWSVLTRLEDF